MKTHYSSPIFAERLVIIGALVLGGVKISTGILSGSLALLASGIDSVLDSGISFLNLITLREAARPADKEHPYGHGKFEAFAELAQGVLICIVGILLAKESFEHILSPPHQTLIPILGIGVMILSLVGTLGIVLFLRHVANITQSLILKADAAHYLSDVFSNGAIILGLGASFVFEVSWIDPLLSLGVSGIIIFSAVPLLKESFSILTDHEADPHFRAIIIEILQNAPAPITGWHCLRTRFSGTQLHIDFHLVFNEHISLHDAHAASEELEKSIQDKIPNAILLTHLDPHDDQSKNISSHHHL